MASTLLTLMTFPQRWDPKTGIMEIRVAALPFTNPLAPIAAGQPAFSDVDLNFQLRVIPSLLHLPKSVDAQPPVSLGSVGRPHRSLLLQHLNNRFDITKAPPAAPGISRRIKKYLPVSYRESFDFPGSQHELVKLDSSYRCSFESAQTVNPKLKPKNQVTWGEVLGYVLRNRLLAEEAGLLFQFTHAVGDVLASGGWLYVELQAATAFAGLAGVNVYAARIPPLSKKRSLFAAIQFPVDLAAANDDARIFMESESYSDGFAKIVHGAQPVSTGALDTEGGSSPPIRDRGIRLGWDDEQITTWMNRQIGLDPFTNAAPQLPAPLAVLGYRVDVRPAASNGKWTSLSNVKGDIVLEAIAKSPVPALDLGSFEGELSVETIPLNLQGKKNGDYWLPSHFVSWTGGSIVLSDPNALAIDSQDDLLAAQRFTAVGADAVSLRYGRNYEFRVRLMDLSSGGPKPDEDFDIPGPASIATVRFRRCVPPRAPIVRRNDGGAPPNPPAKLEILRPRLGYPDALFALGSGAVTELVAERNRILSLPPTKDPVEVGVPDPDASSVRIKVEVFQLAHDEAELRTVYSVTRDYPADRNLPLELDIAYEDVHDAFAMTPPGANEPIKIPTSRKVRISFQSVGKDVPDYFGTERARFSATSTVLTITAPSHDETKVFVAQSPSDRLRACFLQPDLPQTGLDLVILKAQGIRQVPEVGTFGRLAQALDLECDGKVMWAKKGRRVLFGACAGLPHQLGVDHASITFPSQTDLVRHWIIALHLKLNRDWTWDALEEHGLRVYRGASFVGTVDLPRVVNPQALIGGNRSQIEAIFFDAIDPKPQPGEFPKELEFLYQVEPVFRNKPTNPPEDLTPALRIRVPVATPPLQTPRVVSAGFAFSPFVRDERYSSTQQRRRVLWLEFDKAPDDPQDRYYARLLAHSPDPMLMAHVNDPLPEPPEPALSIDPEPIRVIVPDQAADDSGSSAMQELKRAPDVPGAVHYFLYPPDNTDEGSPELFDFYTYELRAGHNGERWSLAKAKYGPPLRLTGVQHPAPSLICQVSRDKERIRVRAPLATPVLNGIPQRPLTPQTDIWVMLYAQVLQLDGEAWRNVLLGHVRAERFKDESHNRQPRPETILEFANGVFDQQSVEKILSSLGLSKSSPLSVLAAELIPETVLGGEKQPPRRDPLQESLGDVRILRTSPLQPVPPVC